MTQEAAVLRHLKEHGNITAYEALLEYGIFRLAARVYNLRLSGHDIATVMIDSQDKRFARYVLK